MRGQGPEQPPADPAATLSVTSGRGPTQAVVLLLHGGKAVSREVSMSTHLSVLRMIPLGWAVRRQARRCGISGVAVWRLRYRYRGWNGAEASPVTDARWALAEVRRRHGDVPVVLVGHSMGGRVAVHVGSDPHVAGLVLLAPWLYPGEPRVEGKPVLVLHGDRDRITSPQLSEAWARRSGAELRIVPGGEHFMLRHLRLWHRWAARAAVDDVSSATKALHAV